MFQHNIDTFGTFKKHTISNAQGDSFSIVPAHGANLLDLQFGGQSVLDGFKTPEELIVNGWGKNIILFPFPNRLRDGQYTHDGITYQFEINNADTQNAIHGFSYNVPMDITEVHTDTQKGSITCTYIHDGSHKAYPFRFEFHITFTLSNNALEVNMTFKNLDTKAIPVGLGWHPYFRLSEKVDDTLLQMPDCQLVDIDDRMLPTGIKTPYKGFENLKKIDSTFLDNGFYITDQSKNAYLTLQFEDKMLSYWQETGLGKWNFMQVFTPPHRMSIAVEPMTCNVDAFNNKDGLTILEPHATLGGNYGVKFSKA